MLCVLVHNWFCWDICDDWDLGCVFPSYSDCNPIPVIHDQQYLLSVDLWWELHRRKKNWVRKLVMLLMETNSRGDSLFAEVWRSQQFINMNIIILCVVMYYTSGFRTEIMYNFYIVMKSMFLGCKTILPPYFWLCKPHHYPSMNYTQTIPKTIQKTKSFFPKSKL
jgi:hypothetical protein